jgi:hypothetical protein
MLSLERNNHGERLVVLMVSGDPTVHYELPFPLSSRDSDFARKRCQNTEWYVSSSFDFPDEYGFTEDEAKGVLTDIFGKRGWVKRQ